MPNAVNVLLDRTLIKGLQHYVPSSHTPIGWQCATQLPKYFVGSPLIQHELACRELKIV
jgi:hypothetical protein